MSMRPEDLTGGMPGWLQTLLSFLPAVSGGLGPAAPPAIAALLGMGAGAQRQPYQNYEPPSRNAIGSAINVPLTMQSAYQSPYQGYEPISRNTIGGAVGSAPAARQSPQSMLDLLTVTDAELADAQRQLATMDPNHDPVAYSTVLQRVQGLEGRRANIVSALDQRGFEQEKFGYEQTRDAAHLKWQIDNAAAQRGQRADEFAAQMGYNYAQLDQADRHHQQQINEAWRRQEAQFGFQRAENAADRQQQLNMLAAQQGFTRDENAADRQWRTGEREATQGFSREERQADQGWRTGERRESQDWQAGQSEVDRRWRSGEAGQQRDFEAQQTIRNQEFVAAQNTFNRELQREMARMQQEVALGRLDLDRANLEFQKWAEGRAHELKQIAENNVMRRWEGELKQRQQEFGETMGQRKYEFEATTGLERERLGENRRQFDTRFGEDRRQFDEQLGYTKRRDALSTVRDLMDKGHSLPGAVEYQAGGRPGGSLEQISAAFGGQRMSADRFIKPQMDLDRLNQAATTLADGTRKTAADPAIAALLKLDPRRQQPRGAA